MSKLALYLAITGAASAGVVAVAVVTGAIDLPGSKPDPAQQEQANANKAPEVAVLAPKSAPAPEAGAETSLIADPVVAVPDAQPEVEKDAAPAPDSVSEPVSGPEAEPEAEAEPAVVESPAALEPETEPEDVAVVEPEPETAADAPDVEVASKPDAPTVPAAEPTDQGAADTPTPVVEAPVVETTPEVVANPGDVQSEDIQTEAAQAVVPAPRFDIVRAETDGSTLVAGVAEPGTQLEVLVDGKTSETVKVGSDGRFVTFVDLPAKGAASVLTLRNDTPAGASVSEEQVIVTPAIPAPTPKEESVATVADVSEPVEETDVAQVDVDAPKPVVDTAVAPEIVSVVPDAPAEPEQVAALESTAPVEQDGPTAEARTEPEEAEEPTKLLPPTVLISSARGVEVLQTAPVSPGEVALDSISYDEDGEVLLAGRGEEAASVRVYLDNTPITTSRIEADGRWRVELPEVDTGTYTLRVDQIDASGAVTARVESPFLRESAELLASALGTGSGPVRSITVQPGHTLWEISTNRYGEGKDYVRVFDANRDRIGDPDLIYPGQVFDLPD
ncbi:hypothetical protein [uncultured Pelagimonas sp.]|uniref:LysM peptidoglycan-binding domain-containing protein n=1 Tax=uncultured Pelagimonas sp. TaxID=1618102 RepID=UPI0026342698|nr:hypothetical protein [uncultured Pelagimonas sp.]